MKNTKLQKQYKNAQKNINKNKLESIPDDLKFITELSDTKKVIMRSYMTKSPQILTAIFIACFVPFGGFLFPVISLASLYFFIQGKKYFLNSSSKCNTY